MAVEAPPPGATGDEQTWWRNGRGEKRSDPCAVERGGTGDAVVVRNRLVRVAKGCFRGGSMVARDLC